MFHNLFPSILYLCFSHEGHNHFCKLLSFIFLEEMPRPSDGCMGLPSGTRNQLLKKEVTATRDRIAVAECCQEWFPEGRKHLPRFAVGRCRRIIRGCRHERGEDTGALLV